MGSLVLPSSPANFGKVIAEETEKWAKVIKLAGIRPEWSAILPTFHKSRSAKRD